MPIASLRGIALLRGVERLRKKLDEPAFSNRLTDRDLALLEIALVALLELVRLYRHTHK